MSDYTQKVLWGEGMMLTPQHFQQSDRYLEDLVHRRARALRGADYGLLNLRLDTEALAAGELKLIEGAGVFREGVLVSFPNYDQPPAPRKIEPAYPAGSPSLGVYLAIPRSQPGELICRDDPTSQALTPYDSYAARLRDELGAGEDREIRVGRKRLRILFTSEARDAFATLAIAVIRRTATGGFELDDQFIPTCQYVSASPRLMSVLRRLLESLVTKAGELAKQRRHQADGKIDMTSAESANFWFLYTLNQFLPRIRSLLQHPWVPPFEVYQELIGLAGALCTFSGEVAPTDLPAFNPDDLTSTFLPLESTMLKLLGTVLPSRCVPIRLELERDLIHVGQINDERLLSGARWYLGVMSDVPPEKTISELPHKAKISANDRVDELMIRAMPGLGLEHIDQPPGEIPTKAGRVYFEVVCEGEHWEAIRASSTVGVYVPAEFAGLKLDLMAVKD